MARCELCRHRAARCHQIVYLQQVAIRREAGASLTVNVGIPNQRGNPHLSNREVSSPKAGCNTPQREYLRFEHLHQTRDTGELTSHAEQSLWQRAHWSCLGSRILQAEHLVTLREEDLFQPRLRRPHREPSTTTRGLKLVTLRQGELYQPHLGRPRRRAIHCHTRPRTSDFWSSNNDQVCDGIVSIDDFHKACLPSTFASTPYPSEPLKGLSMLASLPLTPALAIACFLTVHRRKPAAPVIVPRHWTLSAATQAPHTNSRSESKKHSHHRHTQGTHPTEIPTIPTPRTATKGLEHFPTHVKTIRTLLCSTRGEGWSPPTCPQ